MEPNYHNPNEPWTGGQGYPPCRGGVRRPVEDGTRAQRPLGSGGTGAGMPYRRQEPQAPWQPGDTRPGWGEPPSAGPQPADPRLGGGWQEPPPSWQGEGSGPMEGTFPPAQAPWTDMPPYQAAPPDPFEEPGEAPELREARSDNIYDRDRTFWHPLGDLQMQPPPAQGDKPRACNGGHAIRWVVIIAAVVALVGFVVYGQVFQARSIQVQGNRIVSSEEVLRLAGLGKGVNTLSLNEDAIQRGIESNRYLTFVCVEVDLPGSLTVQVRERVPAAMVKYCGILYVVDNRGMVLEETYDVDAVYENMITVEGLDIRQCEVGKSLTLSSAKQMNIYTTALIEMKVMGAMDQILELDLSDMDNLFLVSKDGYAVRLGSGDSLHAKLRSMLLTLDKLRQEGHGPGTVDVSDPVHPTYIPETQAVGA